MGAREKLCEPLTAVLDILLFENGSAKTFFWRSNLYCYVDDLLAKCKESPCVWGKPHNVAPYAHGGGAFCLPRNTKTIKAATFFKRGHDGFVKHDGFVQHDARLHRPWFHSVWANNPFSMTCERWMKLSTYSVFKERQRETWQESEWDLCMMHAANGGHTERN